MTKGSPRWHRGPEKPQLPIMRRQTTASGRFRSSSTMQIASPPLAGQTGPSPMTTRQCCESAICSRLRAIVWKRSARLAHDRGHVAHPQARHRRSHLRHDGTREMREFEKEIKRKVAAAPPGNGHFSSLSSETQEAGPLHRAAHFCTSGTGPLETGRPSRHSSMVKEARCRLGQSEHTTASRSSISSAGAVRRPAPRHPFEMRLTPQRRCSIGS